MGPLIARLPAEPGVYRFRDARERVLYVGRARHLRRRVASYWGDLGDRPHLARMVPRIARIEALVCASAHEAAWLERNLLERALPPWNRTAGGQEVEVYLGVDLSPATPGLRVTHRPESAARRWFGPYLGGATVRQAATALDRIFPLGATSERATASVRELAAAGRGPADRVALGEALAAVLERDPVAVADVLGELGRRRDEASAALAFEAAATWRDGLLAVEWIVAPQRVTVAEPVDAELRGWAHGSGLRFSVCAGRLCGWEREPGPTGVGEIVPPGWEGFARRNAELAAELGPPSRSTRAR